MLWGLLNDLSSLTILSMIAIDVPGIAQTILGYILTFTQLDILPSELIFGYLFTFDDDTDKPLSQYFETAGISSMNSLKNMGSTAIYLCFNLLLFLFILLCNICGRPEKVKYWVNRRFLWNHFIRSLIQQYLALFISSFIQVSQNNLRFNPSGEGMATFIACLALLLTSILPLLMFLLIKQNLIGQITNSLQFGTVTQGLKRDTHFKQLLHTLGLLKWQLTIIVLVLLRNHPSQQLQLLIPLSILYQIYLIRYQPYESSTENKFCLFNELLVSSVLYLYIVASDYNEVIEMRDYSGLGIIGVISIGIGGVEPRSRPHL